jgi:hypothetical protein
MTKQGFLLAGITSLLIFGGSAIAASNGDSKGGAQSVVPAVAGASTTATSQLANTGASGATNADQLAPVTFEGTDLARAVRRDASIVSIMRVPGGTRLDVGGGFRNVFIARITPEGKVETACIISEQEAARFFAPQPDKGAEKPKEH